MGLLDSRSVLISLMTEEIRQIGWTFFFQSGFSLSKGLERKVAKEMAGLKAFILPLCFLVLRLCTRVWEEGEKSFDKISVLCMWS
jgi:hypothetical protein